MENNYNGWNNRNSRSSGPGKAKGDNMEIKVTSPLTKQQLLIPRVLCIGKNWRANNPHSGWYVEGDILTEYNKYNMWDSANRGQVYFDPIYLEMYPHLYKELKWYEMREPDELPEYIKYDFHFYKVSSYDIKIGVVTIVLPNGVIQVSLKKCFPADEADYQEYQKQKQ